MLGCVLAVAGLSGVLLVAPATAASPTKNGQVHACYKVRGKAKGAMRVVTGKHCRRGERKLNWNISGPPGASGATGSQGSQGAPGAQGNPGASGGSGSEGSNGASLASLETKVASLTLEVSALEKLLAGVGNGDLSGLLNKLNGITGTELDNAVNSLPVVSTLAPKVSSIEGLLEGVGSGDLEELVTKLPSVESTVSGLTTTVGGLTTKAGTLCTQAKELTKQSNLLGTSFGEIKVLSGLVTLELPKPAGLTEFTAC